MLNIYSTNDQLGHGWLGPTPRPRFHSPRVGGYTVDSYSYSYADSDYDDDDDDDDDDGGDDDYYSYCYYSVGVFMLLMETRSTSS